MVNHKKDEYAFKSNRRTSSLKRRLKSSVVRDPNGSVSTFRQFYQSGGRDYEQYRLWLQTLSTSKDNHEKIKHEPLNNKSLISTLSVPKIESMSTSVRPSRPLPLILSTSSLLPLSSTSTFTFQRRLPCEHFPISTTTTTTSLSLIAHWSVEDVAQFIHIYFSDRTIVEKFIEHKIDGRTLPLLTEDHLTRIFKMKLGPALHLLDLLSNIKSRSS